MTATTERLDNAAGATAHPRLPRAADAPATGGGRAPVNRGLRGVWRSSIGKKYVMAVTGLLMLAFLLLHMLGNLKIFYGPRDFNSYSEYLRTIGTPILHGAWYLWIQRTVLTVAFVLHVTAAYQLSRRDQKSRPVDYAHRQPIGGGYTTHIMRWGGVTLLLFLIWHILDLSAGVANPGYHRGNVYGNVVADFTHWWPNVIYILAMLMLGLHIQHGFWSAAMTLGYNRPARDAAIKGLGIVLSVGIAGGFIVVPVAVMAGLVS